MARHLTLEELNRIAHLKLRSFAEGSFAKALECCSCVISETSPIKV